MTQTLRFLDMLFGRIQSGFLTLTAIHPDGKRRTPSRHIKLSDKHRLHISLKRLLKANAMGWGAYVAVGLRRVDLGRYRRGGVSDVVALPALYADIDTKGVETLHRLRSFEPSPSCIVDSGGGFHLYWLLEQPTTDLTYAGRILKHLAKSIGGDPMSVAQSLRLPGSLNTKSGRNNALCQVIEMSHHRYMLHDFDHLLPAPKIVQPVPRRRPVRNQRGRLNPDLIRAIRNELMGNFAGFHKRNDYIASLCPLGQHTVDYPGQHFNFDPMRGYGHCFGKHGTANLRELCDALGLDGERCGELDIQSK